MKFRAFVAGAIVLSLLGAMPARAEDGDAITRKYVGIFYDGGRALGLLTANNKSQRAVALIIQGSDPSKKEYKPRYAWFDDAHQWDKLVALWDQARRTPPPMPTPLTGTPTSMNMGTSTDIGSYWDSSSEALVDVSVTSDATIEFSLVDKDKWPMFFELQPKDFEEFDRDVKQVSTFFAK
jgi:hypothetical protein